MSECTRAADCCQRSEKAVNRKAKKQVTERQIQTQTMQNRSIKAKPQSSGLLTSSDVEHRLRQIFMRLYLEVGGVVVAADGRHIGLANVAASSVSSEICVVCWWRKADKARGTPKDAAEVVGLMPALLACRNTKRSNGKRFCSPSAQLPGGWHQAHSSG